jgi:hypothetical protein
MQRMRKLVAHRPYRLMMILFARESGPAPVMLTSPRALMLR